MTKKIIFWVLAVIITLFTAYYQRVSGPTYPASGTEMFQGKDIMYKFDRSHTTGENCQVKINIPFENAKATLLWKRYKTNDDWTRVEMSSANGVFTADLPGQPPAAKLEYKVRIVSGNAETTAPDGGKTVVIRFKGDVPWYVLIPHIILIFAGMLYSTRAGIEFFNREKNIKILAFWAAGLLLFGGFVLGPLVQKYAFGEYWTGIPFGWDLTDNKMLFAGIAWIVALFSLKFSKKPEVWILGASVATLIIFLIPHSMFGSELDWSKVK